MKFSNIATVLSVLLITTFASPIGEPQYQDSSLSVRSSSIPSVGEPLRQNVQVKKRDDDELSNIAGLTSPTDSVVYVEERASTKKAPKKTKLKKTTPKKTTPKKTTPKKTTPKKAPSKTTPKKAPKTSPKKSPKTTPKTTPCKRTGEACAVKTTAQHNYDAISHLATAPGWHAFYYAWDKVAIKDDPEMEELTTTIGGKHIAILVGEITADKSFTGVYYHIVRADRSTPTTPANREGMALTVAHSDFDAVKRPYIKATKLYGTPKITGAAVLPVAEKVWGGKTYAIKTFNCAIYSDDVWAAIK
ncbi:hypothetical protein G7Y89_g11067 [Cudoniella acicularis]|uniref:Uncharacterized protein n=1 Tax=Cudoniella acicularis TaxID=354080 RepID=A0A8H4W100_9HELO|nr:hypothetical protein G7Y89_g11067 [Cudoniella acicularis]